MEEKIISATQVKNGFVLSIDGKPCKIINFTITVEGKHGSAKVHIHCKDMITDKKYYKYFTGHDKLTILDIKKHEGILVDMEDSNDISVLSEENKILNNVKIIDDKRDEIKTLYDDNKDLTVQLMTIRDDIWITGYKIRKKLE